MRTFVYFSQSARTSGNFDMNDLMSAGRMDIAMHIIINAFFLSHKLRDDVTLHLVYYGMPKHIEIRVNEETKLSKKDVANLIKKILYKYKPGQKTEVVPGCFIEKKSFLDVIEELSAEGKEIFILDEGGVSIRDADLGKNSVFIIGDHNDNGLPRKELKRLKKKFNPVSVGPEVYFASQVVTIINNELDLREIEN